MSINNILPKEKFLLPGVSLFDVLVVPPETTDLLPQDVDLSVDIGHGVVLKVPVMTAAMEISESSMATAIAREGGLGVIHANLSLEEQVWEVKKVIRAEQNFLPNPYYVGPQSSVKQAYDLMKQERIGGFPVVSFPTLRILGMVTQKDISRVIERNPDSSVTEVMTPRKKLVVAPFETSAKEGLSILKRKGIKKLPLVDKKDRLRGMIVEREKDRYLTYPNACRNKNGCLQAAASVFVSRDLQDTVSHARALVKAGADVIVIDASVGWSTHVHEATKLLRKILPNTCLVSANIVTAGQAKNLIEFGVDAIRVGYGPGSTCVSRNNLGTGVPQVTAVYDVANVAIPAGVCVIADGGVEYFGQAVVDLTAGASVIMSGRLFAGCEEVAPAMQRIRDGKKHSIYRGMGSYGAMGRRTKNRYHRGVRVRAHIAEGVEADIPITTSVTEVVSQLGDALQRAMALNGAKHVKDLWARPLIPMTSAGQLETSQRIKT